VDLGGSSLIAKLAANARLKSGGQAEWQGRAACPIATIAISLAARLIWRPSRYASARPVGAAPANDSVRADGNLPVAPTARGPCHRLGSQPWPDHAAGYFNGDEDDS